MMGNGCSFLSTIGTRRFKVLVTEEQDGYDMAKVQYIQDEKVPPKKLSGRWRILLLSILMVTSHVVFVLCENIVKYIYVCPSWLYVYRVKETARQRPTEGLIMVQRVSVGNKIWNYTDSWLPTCHRTELGTTSRRSGVDVVAVVAIASWTIRTRKFILYLRVLTAITLDLDIISKICIQTLEILVLAYKNIVTAKPKYVWFDSMTLPYCFYFRNRN